MKALLIALALIVSFSRVPSQADGLRLKADVGAEGGRLMAEPGLKAEGGRLMAEGKTQQSGITGQLAVASFYGEYHHGKLTASGERFDRWGMTCAHRTLPLGSWVSFRNPANGRTALCRVTDRGPYRDGREFDLSEGAYRQLARGTEEKGLLKIEWRRR